MTLPNPSLPSATGCSTLPITELGAPEPALVFVIYKDLDTVFPMAMIQLSLFWWENIPDLPHKALGFF